MEITIVQQNLDAFKAKNERLKERQQKLITEKQYDNYVINLMDWLLKVKPDILMLSEFCYEYGGKAVIEKLKQKNYKIIFPKGFRIIDNKNLILDGEHLMHNDKRRVEKLFDDRVLLEKLLRDSGGFLKNRQRTSYEKDFIKRIFANGKIVPEDKKTLEDLLEKMSNHKSNHKDRWTVCILAIKEGTLGFKRSDREELAENDLRYITGDLVTTKGKGVKIFFTHVPSGRAAYKAEMLFAAYCFYIENESEHCFLGGDFNSDIEHKTTVWPLFKKLHDVTEDTGPKGEGNHTYIIHYFDKKKSQHVDIPVRYDYALASKSLVLDCKCETEPPIDTISECGTDHKALLTTITLYPSKKEDNPI